jgi:Antidote-toxin recognition MazE, bacterial antitoxin
MTPRLEVSNGVSYRIDKISPLFYDLLIDNKKGGIMGITTISPKYQVVIPKEAREKLHLKKGQKMWSL